MSVLSPPRAEIRGDLTSTGMQCDIGGCPALAARTVLLHGQDFHFCNHHVREVEVAVRRSRNHQHTAT